MVKHAQICGPTYYEEFRANEGRISPKDREVVEKFADKIITRATLDESFKGTLKFYPERLVQLSDRLNYLYMTVFNSEVIYNTFDSLVPEGKMKIYIRPMGDELNGGLIIHKAKFQEVYDEYLKRPCHNFLRVLGSVLLRALWDTETIGGPLESWNADRDLRYRFHYSLLQFKVCAVVVGRPELVVVPLMKYAKHMNAN